MKLKAYKTVNARRALRVLLTSDCLDHRTLEEYRTALDCVTIAADMYISLFISSEYPIINIDEYFNYLDLLGIDINVPSKELEESFPILLDILETKYGIEYAECED